MFLQFILICSVFNTLYVAVASRCYKDEYRAGLECCPACPPGKHVERDCTESSMTKCTDCTNGTFQEGLNEQKQCSNCTKCDTGLGLKVKKSCTSTSDALCEPLDGYFCIISRKGCLAAQRHTVCSPGQYISQRGTADKDTECLQCTDGTFSDGTSSCQPHTICESVGLKQINPGTDSTDSECGEHGADTGLVAGIIVGVILVMALITTIAIIQRTKRRAFEHQILEKKAQELERQRTEWLYRKREEFIQERERKRTELENRRLEMNKKEQQWEKEKSGLENRILEKKKREQQWEKEKSASAPLILNPETPEQNRQLTAAFRKYPPKRTPAVEEASVLPSSPLLSTEHPAGQATSSTPSTSSETQPATASAHLILEKKKSEEELKRQKTGFEQRLREKENIERELKKQITEWIDQLEKETAEQKRKLTALAHLILEEETAEQKSQLTGLAHLILHKETPEQKSMLTERIDQLDKETAERKRKLFEGIDQLDKDTREQKRQLTAAFRKYLPKRTPAVEEESVLSSSPLLSTEHPAGQATSSTPATSSETQPATETTPLMSSDSPEPTSDLQEHTITIHAVTIDDHDDDQSLDPLTGHPEV